MTKTPYFDKNGKKKGAWSKEEDSKLIAYIERYGHWNWSEIPRFAGVSRCGKSCRLRWMNYLRPNMKRGKITKEEEDLIIKMHGKFGNKWSTIATKLSGRSDNEIKNYWNTYLRKRAKQDQLSPESFNPAKSKEIFIGNQIEEASSSESSSAQSSLPPSTSSSPRGLTAMMESQSSSLNNFDGSVSNFIPSFCFENVGCFWTDPFLADADSAPMNEYSSSFDLAQVSSHVMLTDDEFLWSTMKSYDEYHRQLQK